jgi:hypothetical protein
MCRDIRRLPKLLWSWDPSLSLAGSRASVLTLGHGCSVIHPHLPAACCLLSVLSPLVMPLGGEGGESTEISGVRGLQGSHTKKVAFCSHQGLCSKALKHDNTHARLSAWSLGETASCVVACINVTREAGPQLAAETSPGSEAVSISQA